MHNPSNSGKIRPRRLEFAFISILVLIWSIYGSSLNASWQFDDYGNIVNNKNVELRTIDAKSFHNAMKYRSGMNRPIARITFAINWYFDQYKIRNYRVVNILIHFLAAWIVFLIIINILNLPKVKCFHEKWNFIIALLACMLWAANPIQTQAVTYVVQRMTSMAALFYLLGMFSYLKARINNYSNKKLFFLYALSALCFVLALGSKENAITLPLSLLLLEIVFFQNIRKPEDIRIVIVVVLSTTIVLLLLGVWLFLDSRPLSIINYSDRPFTLFQRILTQPRVIIFYLSQIFYPIPQRLSIEHDIIVSNSFLSPLTTGLAVAAIIMSIGGGVYLIKKHAIVSFAVLFFFLNHLVEASIIPLEMVFEHRNYLPSVFLFLPVAMGICRLINRLKESYASYLLTVSVGLFIFGLGMGTHIRNMAWATERSLWEDAIEKTGELARPYRNLATQHYAKAGMYGEAIFLLEKSINLRYAKLQYRAKHFHNMAAIFYKLGAYQKAIQYEKEALKIYPGQESHYTMVLSLIQLERLDEALNEILSSSTKSVPHRRKYLNLAGKILIQKERYSEALVLFQQALKLDLNNFQSLLNIGISLSKIGRFDLSTRFLSIARRIAPHDLTLLMAFIEKGVRSDDAKTDQYLNKLFASRDVLSIIKSVKEIEKKPVLIPLSEHFIIPVLSEKIESISCAILKNDCFLGKTNE